MSAAGRRQSGENCEPRPSLRERTERYYTQVVAEALANPEAQLPLPTPRPRRRGSRKRRPGQNLALRLRNCRESVLRCLHEPAVPFTHNQAEQDMRMWEVRPKISGGFRSEQGAQHFATLRSMRSRVRKQGRDRLEALLQRPGILGAPLPA